MRLTLSICFPSILTDFEDGLSVSGGFSVSSVKTAIGLISIVSRFLTIFALGNRVFYHYYDSQGWRRIFIHSLSGFCNHLVFQVICDVIAGAWGKKF